MTDAQMLPHWFKEVLQMTERERTELIGHILEAVSREGSLNDKPTKSGLDLVKMLKRDCELQGFCPNSMYARAKGKDLKDMFFHKWGYPTLLYKHKKLPIVISVNPGMRKDTMMLSEIPHNKRLFEGVYVVGLTS